MAEFQEVMRQWRRFCKSHNHCGECEFDGKGICGEAHLTDVSYTDIELRIMAWAKEHPEPVYPTWLEWLQEMGVMTDIHDRLNNYKQVMEVCGKPLYSIPTTKVFCHIAADIAEKLGIEPKGEA